MGLAVEEVLSLWREAERLLDELPVDALERQAVSREVRLLMRLYKRVTDEHADVMVVVAADQATIDGAHATLRAARGRHSAG